MCRLLRSIVIAVVCLVVITPAATAQDPITEAIKQGVIKVIKALDLQVQRIQTRTIWLQNAQKVLENKMSELKLNEISDWADRQKTLYQNYFDELQKVKGVISGYSLVRSIVANQRLILLEYRQAFTLFRENKDFSSDEIEYMSKVYNGIISESGKSIDQLQLVINSFSTQMTDGQRLQLISKISEGIDGNLNDLRRFNNQSRIILAQRAGEKQSIDKTKVLYGLPK